MGVCRTDRCLDYFAGSGTTAHAVIDLNREDGGHRKYILVEMGDYFDTVLKPRIQKVIYSKDWKDGKPVWPARRGRPVRARQVPAARVVRGHPQQPGVPHARRAVALASSNDFREDYTLRYMLDVGEPRQPAQRRPFRGSLRYTLKVATGIVGETRAGRGPGRDLQLPAGPSREDHR